MPTVSVQFNAEPDGKTIELEMDERVYPDRTCGQYEGGWLCFDPAHPEIDERTWFVSDEGTVYVYATDVAVGYAPDIKAAFDRAEAYAAHCEGY